MSQTRHAPPESYSDIRDELNWYFGRVDVDIEQITDALVGKRPINAVLDEIDEKEDVWMDLDDEHIEKVRRGRALLKALDGKELDVRKYEEVDGNNRLHCRTYRLTEKSTAILYEQVSFGIGLMGYTRQDYVIPRMGVDEKLDRIMSWEYQQVQ